MKTAVRVGGALFLLALGSAAFPVAGCGSDSGSKSTSGTGGSGGGTGTPDAGPATGAGGIPAGSAACGSKVCTPPDSTFTACCISVFQGQCGVLSGTTCAAAPTAPPKGCPTVPPTMGITVPPCCTTTGLCGVDLKMFGMGCVDSVTAAAQAKAMGFDTGQMPVDTKCTPGDGGT